MKRLLGLIVAIALVVVGPLSAPATAAPLSAESIQVSGYTYDGPDPVEAPASATTERGPPATHDPRNAFDADNRWSRGALARSGAVMAGLTTTYATRETLAGVVRAATTTGGQARGAEGDLCALLGWVSAANSGNRVFWSGGDVAKNAAADYAEANRSKTLEMTLTGRALERIPYNRFTKPVTGKLWDAASWRFARGARGDAHVFFGPNAPRPGSVFARIEGPILDRRGNTILQHFLE